MAVELASLLTELSAGRRPLFVQQLAAGGGPPSSTSSGVSCLIDGSGKSALVTTVAIQLRGNPRARVGIFYPAYVNGDTYSFYLSGLAGTPVSYTAGPGEDEEDIVAGLAAALLAEPNHAALLIGLATLDGANSTFGVKGKTWDDWVLAGISSTTPGKLIAVLEPSSTAFFPWVLPAGIPQSSAQPLTPVETWFRPLADGAGTRVPTAVDWQGYCDTFNTGSVAAFYVEIDADSTAGPAGEVVSAYVSYVDPRIYIGPASRESAQTGV